MRAPDILKIDVKNAFGSILLVVNPLIWYYAVIIFLQKTLAEMTSNNTLTNTDAMIIWGIHFSGIIFAALLGTLLAKKIDTNKFLIAWMTLGSVSTLTLFAFDTSSLLIIGLIVLLLGVSLGIGMPTCMGYYTNAVPIEKRGRISGLVMLLTGVGMFAFSMFASIDLVVLGVVLVSWRLFGLLVFYFSKSKAETKKEKDTTSYKHVLGQQSVIFYLIPWVMFSLVNYLAGPAQEQIINNDVAIANISLIQNIMMGIFAVIGGFLLDSVGRKRIAIAGFVMLGIDTATLGLFPTQIWSNYLSATVDGIAFGFLWVIFIVTIWGDLSHSTNSSKYYAIGVLPFFISKLLELTVGKDISNYIVSSAGNNGLFSFLAFFLFLAVLPLVYAPETLPEKVMKDRDLKSYVEKAKKKVQKESSEPQKENNDQSKGDDETQPKPKESCDEYEEAQKLAEKYY